MKQDQKHYRVLHTSGQKNYTNLINITFWIAIWHASYYCTVQTFCPDEYIYAWSRTRTMSYDTLLVRLQTLVILRVTYPVTRMENRANTASNGCDHSTSCVQPKAHMTCVSWKKMDLTGRNSRMGLTDAGRETDWQRTTIRVQGHNIGIPCFQCYRPWLTEGSRYLFTIQTTGWIPRTMSRLEIGSFDPGYR